MAFDFEKQKETWETQNNIKATWPKGLLVFSFLLLFLFVGIKFGFDFLNKQQRAIIKEKDNKILEAKEKFPIEDQSAVLGFEKSVKNLKILLENKVKTSSFLTSIANNTHKDIYFTSFNSSAKDLNVEISGVAKNLSAVSQASLAFSQVKGVEGVEVKSVRNTGSSVSFVLALKVQDSFFK